MKEDKVAKVWDERNKNGGEPYKKYVLDPLTLKLAHPFKNKVVWDQGCGNGYLSKKISRHHPAKIVLFDFFAGNLDLAEKNLKSFRGKISVDRGDLNKKISLGSKSVDIAISNMVLSEVKNLPNVLNETHRILKSGGTYVLSVVHPAFTYKLFLKSQYLFHEPTKIIPSRHYFDRRKSYFILGTESHQDAVIRAPHYQRTVADYYSALKQSGFAIESIMEPKPTKELIKNHPRFKQDLDCPIALVIKAQKLG